MLKVLVLNSELSPAAYFKAKGLDMEVTHRITSFVPKLVYKGIAMTGDTIYTPDPFNELRELYSPLEYHLIVYCYPKEWYPEDRIVGYAENESVYIGTDLVTVEINDETEAKMIHEIHHWACMKLNRLGYPVVDLMDRTPVTLEQFNEYKARVNTYSWTQKGDQLYINYYKDPLLLRDEPDSNHNRTWDQIKPYVQYLDDFPPVMKRGMTSPWVKQLQYLLTMQGYFVPFTGYFWYFTGIALKAFQKDRGLVVDEICGAKTLKELSLKKK